MMISARLTTHSVSACTLLDKILDECLLTNFPHTDHGKGADLGLSDPVFQKRLKEHGIDPKTSPNEAGALWIDNVWHGRAHTWEKAQWAMKLWKELSGGKPFCLKGIQSVEDAKKSVEYGFDGIVVSNHAGRQVDGACASLDALEQIVDGKLDLHIPNSPFSLAMASS
jgi:hypothetical protein